MRWVLRAALLVAIPWGCSAPPGLPYTVGVGAHRQNHALEGFATWYGPGFHGRRTASGERFDMNGLTAAHKSLPFGTKVRVTDVRTGRSVVVRINDRGPFGDGILDLSKGAARKLGTLKRGRTAVRLKVLRWGR